MVILHVASITDYKYNGVNVVVPKHVCAHQKLATTGFVNIRNYKIPEIENQFEYNDDFKISNLPKPFCNPDIVVFHDIYHTPFLAISKQLKKSKTPYVIVPHGALTSEAQGAKRIKKIVGNILLFNSFIYGSSAIQCLSENELNTTKFRKRKFIATNGIDIPSEKKMNFNKDKINFLYIGRLDAYHKGLDLLVQAVSLCADDMKRHNCVVTIYGPDIKGRYAHVEGLIRDSHMEDLIKLNPAISGTEKENAILNADVFIQTSRFEGMPMGILESMSYGLPCLVTNGTTLGDIIEENDAGWRCETSADAISKTIKQAIREISCLPIKSVNAVSVAESYFAWQIVAHKAIEEYKLISNGFQVKMS